MIPPSGFTAEVFPLRHHIFYAAGLSPVTTLKNHTIFTFVRNYKTVTDATTVDVNPHHASFVTDAGSVCQPMSIIDKLKMKLQFSLSKVSVAPIKLWWQPMFFSFPEKLDAADEKTTTTVEALLGLLKDATQEDVTPLHGNTKFDVIGTSERDHPLSTVNLTETVAILNMDTDATMEGVTYNDETVQKALKYYTNKGALRACLGRRRFLTLDDGHRTKNYFIDKFVPRAIRRIMPYSYFAIMVHVPKVGNSEDQYYHSTALAADIAFVGVNCKIKYDEWHADFNQKMIDQS